MHEVEQPRCFIEHALVIRHKRQVVKFCGCDGAVAEQKLNAADIYPLLQQANRERIAEPMGLPLDASDLAESHDRPAQGVDACRQAAPVPEEITVRLRLHRRQCFDSDRRQLNLDAEAGLQRSQYQMARGLERGTLEFSRVGDSQSRVEQEQHQRPGAASIHRGGRVARLNLLAGIEQSRNLICGVRQRRTGLRARKADTDHGRFSDPFSDHAVLKESAIDHQLFADRSSGYCAAPNVLRYLANRNASERGIPDGRRQVAEGDGITSGSAFADLACRAVGKEFFYGERQRGAGRDLDHPMLDPVSAGERRPGIGGIKRTAESLPGDTAIRPDWAPALGIVDPVFFAVAARDMAAVEAKTDGLHVGILSPVYHAVKVHGLYGKCNLPEINNLWAIIKFTGNYEHIISSSVFNGITIHRSGELGRKAAIWYTVYQNEVTTSIESEVRP